MAVLGLMMTVMVRAQPVFVYADLGTLGGSSSFAYGINNAGQVVGQAHLPGDSQSHAFRYSVAGGMVDLGIIGGY